MTEKEMQKLSREELLGLLQESEKEEEQLRAKVQKLERENYKIRYRRTLRSTVYTLVTVAAIAVLLATLLFPVLRIYGNSMSPSFQEGDVVVAVKSTRVKQGEVLAFYYNNKILVKRFLAGAGSWVDIDKDGNITVDGEKLEEPYVTDKALGECDIKLPYQVPDERFFVVGDHRSTSVDSRSTAVGCVSEEQLVGKIVLRLWPFDRIGKVY